MYLGTVVESGPTEAVFANPGHPYTAALLRAVPALREVVPGHQAACHFAEAVAAGAPLPSQTEDAGCVTLS